MGSWDIRDMEHGCAKETNHFVVSWLVLEHHGVLGDEVMVCHLDGLWEPGGTAAE